MISTSKLLTLSKGITDTLWTQDHCWQWYEEHIVDKGHFKAGVLWTFCCGHGTLHDKDSFLTRISRTHCGMWPFWQGLNVYFVNTESRVPRTLYGNRIIFARVTWPFCEHKALYATGPMNILWTKRPLWYGYHGHVVKSFWEWYHRYFVDTWPHPRDYELSQWSQYLFCKRFLCTCGICYFDSHYIN